MRKHLFSVLSGMVQSACRADYDSVNALFPQYRDILFQEKQRLDQLVCFDKNISSDLAGVDEAGRGPLAGPVVAACVHFATYPFIPLVDDSKKLKPRERDLIAGVIRANAQISISVISHEVVDAINILQATLLAMTNAVSELRQRPQAVLIDGNRNISVEGIHSQAVVKGDRKSFSIACASIVAKAVRDGIMKEYDRLYPQYGFALHNGYGTKAHLEAIERYGPCAIHRLTFQPLKRIIV